MLGLGIDELNDDEDEIYTTSGLSFIAEKDFIIKYGTHYKLSIQKDSKEIVLTPEK